MARQSKEDAIDVLSGVVSARCLMTKEDATKILNKFGIDGFHWGRVDDIVSLSCVGLLPDQIIDVFESGVRVDMVVSLIGAHGYRPDLDGFLDNPHP